MGTLMLALSLFTLLFTSCTFLIPLPDESQPISESASEPASNPPAEAQTDSAGRSPQHPLPRTATVVTPDWQIQVLEVIRGEAAMQMLAQASVLNRAPDAVGMEYVLVKLHVKYVGTKATRHIYGRIFHSQDTANALYDRLSFRDVLVPEPKLEADLAPGQETEGWVALLAGKNATGLTLIIWPYASYENDVATFTVSTGQWYVSLEEQ
jgi:hypothetical protein